MTAALRIGLVGCGRLAEAGYVPASAAAAGVDLVAVADPDVDRRSRVAVAASASGDTVASFPDAARLIEGVEVDALVLATPAAAHLTDAARSVAAGIPVLVEKPPAVDAAEAAELVSLGPLVRIGFNRRFEPGIRAMRAAILREGDLDLELELRYRRASWAAHTVRDDVILDLGPHLVDLARWLSGTSVIEVTSSELRPDRASLTLAFAGGRARIHVAADSHHRERMEIRDAGGERIARHRVGGLLAAVTGRLRREAGPHPLAASLTTQLEAFARVVHGGTCDELGTASEGHAVMVAIDAARASAADGGRPVPVIEPVEQRPC